MPETNPRNKTFIVERNTGGEPIEVRADKAETDQATGRINFIDGDQVVASFLNASFYRK